ncbi:MAG: hypothetical protein B7Z73_08965 [Planctomycetia bacterium 21-64-5]|nr:MAG: hypothetical protein B7Z73_08965 [Planctomycetia bacterium 21-64-5]
MIVEKVIGEKTQRYRELERESSGMLLDHDSRRVLGRYEEAAFHALQAGRRRASMGKILFDAGDHVGAAEDWLSATACFMLATAEDQIRTLLDIVRRMEDDGDFESRPEMSDILQQRDQELRALVGKRIALLRELALPEYQLDDSNKRALDFLLEQRRELPGYALLHYAISRQAMELGETEPADRHLVWAATFAPENANLIALLGYLRLRHRRRDRAIELAKEFLEDYPSAAGPVRIMLANALSGGHDEPLDRERAIEVLRPLIDENWPDRKERIAALAISAALCYETGRKDELARHVGALRSIERGLGQADLSAYTYIKLCEESLLQAGEAADREEGGVVPLPEAKRQQFFRSAMQLTTSLPLPLAA